jgi:hypothetical protein
MWRLDRSVIRVVSADKRLSHYSHYKVIENGYLQLLVDCAVLS